MWHLFKNRVKIILRNKMMIFWTLIFPIGLGTFFDLALSNLAAADNFEIFDIAVVENNMDESFTTMIESLSTGDDKLFNVTYTNVEEAEEKLKDNDIAGYIIKSDKIDIVVKSSGYNQTILKQVIDSYYQTYSVIENVSTYDYTKINDKLIESINADVNHFEDTSSNNVDYAVVYFYTLIGMACLFTGYFGISAVNETEANLSTKGARLSMSPNHKLKTLVSSLLAGWFVAYIELLILFAYLIFILKVDFGNQVGCLLLLTLVGSLAGITLGMAIGSVSKKDADFKSSILSAVTMSCSFLAGMMIVSMKHIIEHSVPILNRINPVTMITDALYSLYYYDTLNKYFYNIISLIIFSIAMVLLSYVFIRRKKYDSI